MGQMPGPGGFMMIFGLLRLVPYISVVLLIAAIAIWVVFAVKKFKWAKILAIVLTVLVVIAGLLNFIPFIMGRNMPGNPGDRPPFNGEQGKEQGFKNRQSMETNIEPESEISIAAIGKVT